ncbi:unnamed protein product [Miscanthus lutarioriparius]|uniref:Uncharacterized protein n=1 Tax=Miscanthus lutarioriparius TaxID=422564 RepID=A0A811QNU1_9POAL|nr:unnamed protein product [Miscanthus lutarioriparius]
MVNPKAFGENASQEILELEAQIQAMCEAEETLNLELKEAEACVKAAETKDSDLEQQLSEIENKLVASSEQKMKTIN